MPRQKPQWTLLSSLEVIEPRTVYKKLFIAQDGSELEYTVDKAKRNHLVIIFAITEDKKIIVLEQYRPGPEKIMMNIPGGGVENGESVEEAARRELMEETGYSSKELIKIRDLYRGPKSDDIYSFVLAKGCKKEKEIDPIERQIGEIKELTKDEFLNYLERDDITTGDLAGGYIGYNFAIKEQIL